MKTILPLFIILLLGNPAFAETTIFPDSGPIGIETTITGDGFGKFVSTKKSVVLFGKAPALVQQWDNGRIVVRVPSKAVTGPVVIKNGKKTNQVGVFTVEQPVVKEISPASAPAGEIVQILGRNFGPTVGQKDSEMQFGVNEVLFNGVAAQVLEWSNNRIRVNVPLNGTSGPVTLKRGSESRTVGEFRLTPQHVIGFQPDTAPVGSLITISGEHFGVFSDSGPNQV